MNTKLLSRFRDEMQLHGLSVHTQEAYERHLRRFLDDTGYPNGAEIIRLMRSFDSQKQKTVALLCYGAGLRVSEAPTHFQSMPRAESWP